MNATDRMVSFINRKHSGYDSLKIVAKVIDFNMKTVWTETRLIKAEPDRYTELFKIPEDLSLTPVYFVKLQAINAKGSIISENIYWLSSGKSQDFTSLADLEPVKLEMSVVKKLMGKETEITVKLRNNTDRLSFFNRVVITMGENGEEVLPVFWDSNFVILFPGEEKEIKGIFSNADLHDKQPYVKIDGNNLVPSARDVE